MAFYLEIGQIFGYVIKGWIKSRNRGGREVEGEVSEERMGQSAISNFFFFFFFFQSKNFQMTSSSDDGLIARRCNGKFRWTIKWRKRDMWMKIFIKKRGDTGAEPRFSDKRKKRKIWQAELKGLMDAKIWLCEKRRHRESLTMSSK